MKQATLFLGILAISCAITFAQTDCDPDNCWIVTDNSCDNEFNCDDMDGASDGIIFQVSCSGYYTFECKVGDCSSGSCSNCVACAKLVDSHPTIPQVYLCSAVLNNNNDGCTASCTPGGQQVYLTAGGQWNSLQVTLKRCSENTCGSCNCKAKVRVYGDGADCVAW